MKRLAIQVVDLGFGDAGKGTMVDYFVRKHEADLVVRFNGGPQAGHNVVLPAGRQHPFAQCGSGAFVPGLRTLLSRYMAIEPYAMLNEARHLESIGVPDAMARMTIDRACLVITPPQQIANRVRERARGAGAHGTCGMGFGECISDSIQRPDLVLRARDLLNRPAARTRLLEIMEHKRDELAPLLAHATEEERRVLEDRAWIDAALDRYATIADQTAIVPRETVAGILRQAKTSVFEAAQGVLLDERFGFYPHTTWSTTTFANADALLDEADAEVERLRVGVLRTYSTRHGAGPFPTHRLAMDKQIDEPHNANHGWQGHFRRGPLDLPLLRYALAVCGHVDGLAVTHLDRLELLSGLVCERYRLDGEGQTSVDFNRRATLDDMAYLGARIAQAEAIETRWSTASAAWLGALESAVALPVRWTSAGPTWRDKSDRG